MKRNLIHKGGKKKRLRKKYLDKKVENNPYSCTLLP
jgi:hypothetical protein